MERYIGMDLHAASCTLAVISEKGRKLGTAECLAVRDAPPSRGRDRRCGDRGEPRAEDRHVNAYGLAEKLCVGNLDKSVFRAPRVFS